MRLKWRAMTRAAYGVPLLLLAIGGWVAPSYGASAAENYRFHCAQCHGADGRGDGPNATVEMPVSPRDHTSAAEMRKLTDEDIVNAITRGGPATSKSSLMPPYGKTLSRGEILELKDYLRKLCGCKGK